MYAMSGNMVLFLFDPGESEISYVPFSSLPPNLFVVERPAARFSRVHSSLTRAFAGIARTANFPAFAGVSEMPRLCHCGNFGP